MVNNEFSIYFIFAIFYCNAFLAYSSASLSMFDYYNFRSNYLNCIISSWIFYLSAFNFWAYADFFYNYYFIFKAYYVRIFYISVIFYWYAFSCMKSLFFISC